MFDNKFTFDLSTRIIFGEGTLDSIAGEAAKYGRKVMVITGSTATKNYANRVEELLNSQGLSFCLFDGVEPNPSIKTVQKAAVVAKKFGADVFVGLGGGSPMDAAKAISLITTHGGKPSDYFGVDKVPGPITPVIAVPTTNGTGSEVTKYSVISDSGKGTKNLINSLYIAPALALLDPVLTMTMPAEVAAASGIDALTHALESYTCAFATPMTDQLSLEAIRIIGSALPAEVEAKKSKEAHRSMAYASMIAGISINNAGTGIAHGLSFPLTANHGIPHGMATGLLMPSVIEFNLPSATRKYALAAAALGESVTGLKPEEAGLKCAEAVRKLLRRVGIDKTLRELGVSEEKVDLYAESMMANKQKLKNCPRVPTKKDLVEICRKAMG